MEQAIVNNVMKALRHGVRPGLVVHQQRLPPRALGGDQLIDLFIFNRDLNCLVAVELTRGKFKTAYLVQLSGDLSVLDEFERNRTRSRLWESRSAGT